MNGFNLSDIQDARLGGAQLSAIYLGSSKLWPTRDYSKEYLTIESLADNNTITWTFMGSTPIQNFIYWSKDGTSWTSAIASTGNTPVSLATLNTGEKMYLKGENFAYATSQTNYTKLDAGNYFNVYGNIESLRSGDNFANILPENIIMNINAYQGLFRSAYLVDASNLILPATTLNTDCYNDMFNGCSSLIGAPVLPATTLAKACYKRMFRNCTSLTTAPALSATTLGHSSYSYMFQGCIRLTTAPELPATTLTTKCYEYMFIDCASLTTAPALPATTLANSCYYYMFQNCISLITAPALPATTLTDYCYAYMFYGCTSLTTASELPAETLAAGCYKEMFRGCSSLATAPALPATTLTTKCYQNMFYGCVRLSYIKCLATNISASNSHSGWVVGVAASGTFVKPTSMTSWASGTNGIPSGWTVTNI